MRPNQLDLEDERSQLERHVAAKAKAGESTR